MPLRLSKPIHIPADTIDDVRINRNGDNTYIGMYHKRYTFNGQWAWSIVYWGDRCKIIRPS